MNDKFSIVIPYHAQLQTINFIKRQLNYYHFNSTNMFVIIAVSGDTIVKVELEQYIQKLHDSRFIIFTIDENDITNYQSFIKKIYTALQMVTTPYVVINGVDDVIIPEAACYGAEILTNNLDIAAVKGNTIVYYFELGEFLFFKDVEIIDNCPVDRFSLFMKDSDSIFYIIRRTQDLVKEYENINILSEKCNILIQSPYHIEHFLALSVVTLGKVCVFPFPWRIQGSHKNNHTSYTEASFLRIKLGVIDETNYEWFRSVNNNMHGISYNYYKFLWICHQITGISVTLKQIVYNYLYKNCSLKNSIHIFIYFILNKIYVLFNKCFLKQSGFLENGEIFFQTKEYNLLKKNYFSENDIKLIESKKSIN